MFVHHTVVTTAARESAAQKGVRDVFSSIQQSGAVGGGVPVVPMGYEAGFAGGAGYRPDNLAADELDIRDVVVPTRQ